MAVAPHSSNTYRDSDLPRTELEQLELSVVIPCLDEAETIVECVTTALQTLTFHKIAGEVIVADNGSTDGSPLLAEECGARVVSVKEKGYGSALMGGIDNARGRYIVMGDADGSYDFRAIPLFLQKLRSGCDLVQGCRLPVGGGVVESGAMPWLHLYVGNPFFSRFARLLFRTPIHDINCGLRAFSKELYRRIDQRCTGMEFAVEMVLKATLFGESIGEVPITLHPDKRITGKPHLRTFRDGWRTLRFYLLISPRWIFLYPGLFLMAAGALLGGLALGSVQIGSAVLGINTALVSSMIVIVGYQLVIFAALMKIFAVMEGLLPYNKTTKTYFQLFTLERGLLCGGAALLPGLTLIGLALYHWWSASFGDLTSEVTLYYVVPGVLLSILGIQTLFSSFAFSILGMKRKKASHSISY